MALPATTINGYLWHTMKQLDNTLQKQYGNKTPFFPTSDSSSGAKSWENKPYVIYDRIMRPRKSPFPYIKCESILYYLKGNEIQTIEWGMVFQMVLDRMDDAAQDINDWNRSLADPAEIYFHHLKVHQTESGDMGSPSLTRDFSVRPYYITKFVVEADYHFTTSLEDFI
jgi:hypothetical protein